MLFRTLIVTRPADRVERIASQLETDVLVMGAASEREMWRRLGSENFDLVVLESPVVVAASLSTIRQIRELPDRPDVVLLGEPVHPEERAAFLSAGCLALLDSEIDLEVLAQTLQSLISRRRDERLSGHGLAASAEPLRLANFASASPTMQAFLALARRTVHTDSTLLLLGETGVGKEWLARAIHGESPRSNGPFLAVNCAALSESLLESELFGHRRGAFTGASHSRRGHFELAHGGTLFLDEIAELPPHLQAKLLRVLEERTIQALGSERAIEVDVRVMAATNRDLEAEMRERRFRPDLYYRLNVVSLTVPPLRERVEDIPLLVNHFVDRLRTRAAHELQGVHPDAMRALVEHAWPGNVRELINTLERAVMFCAGDRIELRDLPGPIAQAAGARPPGAGERPSPARAEDWIRLPWPAARRRLVEEAERTYFATLLRDERGRVGRVARRAGINPRSLYQTLKRLGLRKEDYRGTGLREL